MRQPMDILIQRYQKSLYTAAFQICRNAEDANDVVQDTFLQYHLSKKAFTDEEHLKAWLLRVAINRAKDLTRSFWRKNRVSFDNALFEIPFEDTESSELFQAVMALPENYRIVIHLHYYEEFTVREIARILRVSEGNVKVRLFRGREALRKLYKEGEES